MGKAVRNSRTNKPPLLSHQTKVLGDQGTDDRATGAILPEQKVGESPIDGVRETAQRLPHMQAVRLIERSASVSRAYARGAIDLPWCEPGRAGKQRARGGSVSM